MMKRLYSLSFLSEPINPIHCCRPVGSFSIKIAVSLYLSEHMEKNLLMESGLYTAIETVIQAQQAAATAAIISSTAASHTHDGN